MALPQARRGAVWALEGRDALGADARTARGRPPFAGAARGSDPAGGGLLASRSVKAAARLANRLLASALAAGCAAAPTPHLSAGSAGEPRVPLVVVPGVTGAVLRERGGGEVVFGTGPRFLLPHDRGYGVARALGSAEDGLEPFAVIREVRLGPFVRRPVYEPLVQSLLAAGYSLGDLARPRPQDDLFLFAYDWRQDNVMSAGALASALERLRAARGAARLEVDLLCQSNGAHICRYYARYGGAALERTEAGDAAPPAALAVRRLLLVGASNGGSLRILREMNRGRRYVPVAGRWFSPEVFFTLASLYDDLPREGRGLFLDGEGRPLEVDLYDPASWDAYGWSVFAPAAARRAERRPDLFGDRAQRLAFLAANLARARRFQAVLAREAAPPPEAIYYLVENGDSPTPARAALVREGGRWETFFVGDPYVEQRPALRALLADAGDGHATLESQRALSAQELAALGEPPRRISGPHFETILEPATLEQLVAIVSAR